MAEPIQFVIGGMAIMCGIVTFAYYAKAGCDPFKAGYISNLNQASLLDNHIKGNFIESEHFTFCYPICK